MSILINKTESCFLWISCGASKNPKTELFFFLLFQFQSVCNNSRTVLQPTEPFLKCEITLCVCHLWNHTQTLPRKLQMIQSRAPWSMWTIWIIGNQAFRFVLWPCFIYQCKQSNNILPWKHSLIYMILLLQTVWAFKYTNGYWIK